MTCFRLLCPLRLWSAAGSFLSMVLYLYCLARLTTSSLCILIDKAFLARFPQTLPLIAFLAVATSTSSPGDASTIVN